MGRARRPPGAIAVASLRAQVAAGAHAVQLFDSWAGSLSPAEYARFALPATRACSTPSGPSACPTILFGVGTGELLALMATAGPDVVGIDWRVPLDEARRRVGPGQARAGQPRPGALPRAVGGGGGGDAGGARQRRAGDGTRQPGHVFNLGMACCPRPTPASSAPSSSSCTPRADAESRRDERGVLVMAHGTPAARTRSSLLHAHPPGPPARRPSSWPTSRGATTPSAASRRSPSARGAGRRPARRARRREPGRYVVAFGAKHTDPSSRTRRGARRRRVDRVVGLVLTPHRRRWARRST